MKNPFKKQKATGRQPLNQQGRPKPAFSYYAGDPPHKVDSVRARQASEHRQAFLKRARLLPTLIALAAILVSAVYSTTLSTNPVMKIAGSASPYRAVNEYNTITAALLQSSIFNQNKLTISSAKTKTSLLKNFPELDVATVTVPVIGRRLVVVLHVRQPALILTTATNAYILDTSGKVVAESSQLLSSSRESLLTVQDQSGLHIKIGDQALTAEAITFITIARAQLSAKKLSITQAVLPNIPNEVDFHIKDQPYYLKTDITGDARLQIGAYLAAKDSGVGPKEYMDLRVEEKVFYK